MLAKLKKYNKLLAVLASLFAFTLIFVGGFFSSNTQLERIAEYATNVVKNNTSNKSLCALTIGKTEDSGSLPDADSEFHNTYGTFMQQRIAFASAVNPDKDITIHFDNIETDNLSLLYGGAVGTISYDDHFKHNTLPIEVMFPDERMYDISNYVIYISQSHADSILDSLSVVRQEDGFHTTTEYNSLLKRLIPISINGVSSDFVIQNIYYQFNYYYDSLFEIMGDFAIFSYYLPENYRSEQRNMYFMDEYFYHNRYFMNYINAAYSSHNYSVKINHYNLVGQFDEDFFLSFYYSKSIYNYDWVYTLIVINAILLLISSLFLIFFINPEDKHNILYSALHLGVLFIPYLIFSMAYRFTGNVYFLSEISSKTNVVILLIYGFIYVILSIYRRRFFQKRDKCENGYYGIDI